MLHTYTRSSWDLQNNYRDLIELVNKHDQVIITNNGISEAALINMDIFAKFEDFLHQGFIYEELQKSKAKLDDPNVRLLDANKVFARIKKKRDKSL